MDRGGTSFSRSHPTPISLSVSIKVDVMTHNQVSTQLHFITIAHPRLLSPPLIWLIARRKAPSIMMLQAIPGIVASPKPFTARSCIDTMSPQLTSGLTVTPMDGFRNSSFHPHSQATALPLPVDLRCFHTYLRSRAYDTEILFRCSYWAMGHVPLHPTNVPSVLDYPDNRGTSRPEIQDTNTLYFNFSLTVKRFSGYPG